MAEFAGVWSEIEVAGKRVELYVPPNPATPPRAVIHLHGHGMITLKNNPVYSALFDQYGLYCVCPHGQRSWWLDTVCEEFDPELTPIKFLWEHLVPEIGQRWQIEPPRIGLTGVSMGGQGVLQLAFRHPFEFPVVAAIAPAVDFHNWHGHGLALDEMFPDQEAARQQTAILQLQSMNWPRHLLIVCDPTDEVWIESARRLTMKLSSSGILYEADLETSNSSPEGGHSWDYFNLIADPVMKFVADKLEKMTY